MTTIRDSVAVAVDRLWDLRADPRGGWSYVRGDACAVEPTALAGLALAATDRPEHARDVADWLAAAQRPDGSLPVRVRGGDEPGWATPHALRLWQTLGSHPDATHRGLDWLLAQAGKPAARTTDSVSGHDGTIPGWPWVAGAHGWVEPTALALLALRGAGLTAHPRLREAVDLLRDRSLPSGGWNYGNTLVFGRELRPQPACTGLTLTALAGLGPCDSPIERAIAYLESALPKTRAPQSLAWGVMALDAWGRRPADADAWLAEALAATLDRPDAPLRLALLILAGRATGGHGHA